MARTRLVDRPSKYPRFPVVVEVRLTPTMGNLRTLAPILRPVVRRLAQGQPTRVVVLSPTDVVIRNHPRTQARV